jgi:hypothetical protein
MGITQALNFPNNTSTATLSAGMLLPSAVGMLLGEVAGMLLPSAVGMLLGEVAGILLDSNM